MDKKNKKSSNSNGSNESTKIRVSIQVPGVDMTQVIPSHPIFLKENSSRPETREDKLYQLINNR